MSNSFVAVLLTTFEYVSNNLRKKQKQFMMAVMTVFLTVSFITFLSSITQLAPINPFKMGMHVAGDIDIMITANSHSQKQVRGNTNFYTDEMEFFNAEYVSRAEQVRNKADHSVLSSVPFVDFQMINNHLKDVYSSSDSEQEIDIFPRWIAMTSLYNLERSLQTSAFMIAGDSKLERNIGVAPGFSNKVLKQDEMITTDDIMTVLGLKIGDMISTDVSRGD